MKNRPKGWSRFVAAYSANIGADRLVDLSVPIASLMLADGLQLAGAYVAAAGFPRLIVGPVLATVLRRHPHRSWCSLGSALQALALSALTVVLFLGVANPATFALAGFVSGLGAGIYSIAAQATIRSLLPPRRLPSGNSTLEMVDSGLTMLVPLGAGFLANALGPAWVAAASSVFFGAAALGRMGLTPGKQAKPRLNEARVAPPVRSRLVTHVSVLRIPFSSPPRRLISIAWLSLSVSSVLMVPAATERILSLGGDSISVGLAVSATGLLGFCGSFLAGRRQRLAYSARLSVTLLVAVVISIPTLLLMPNVMLVIVLVGASDALASWLYVALPSVRMATEQPDSLLAISAGMLTWGALANMLVGVGMSIASSGIALLMMLCAIACALTLAVLLASTTIASNSTAKLCESE